MSYSTKATTLLDLKPVIKSATILDMFFFSVEEWKTSSLKCIEHLKEVFKKDQKLIVRSSSISEDQMNSSKAGTYDSIDLLRKLLFR